METNTATDFSGDEKPRGFLIVAIGASAGGIRALKEFFENVPADSGMAYVVILHLSPDHDSKLAEVLQVVAAIPVLQVVENTKIEPDHIYVVPPNQHLIITDGAIAPSINTQIEDRRAPVDIFFRNLADTFGPRAVGVVLSGTGANGSMGIKRIKERGGVAYVQNPREAEFNEMPRNSIATELVDEVLPVAEISAHIIAYRNSLGSVQIVMEAEKRPEPQQQALREIFTQLRLRTGHDFSNYKRPTLLRRIERRINIRNLPDLSSYITFLQEHPDETQALLKDLLISVTNFFRDAKAFEALEREVLPAIFAGKTSADEVRIWVAGCATGEEAYSVAMLCSERVLGMLDAPKVQIFATDIDETAIATAREGFYTLNDAADVSPDRLRQFFNRDGEGYRVRRELRELILFAAHNFLKDPSFSRLDLVTCRNVLIYLNHTAQERVMGTFHFALRPKGFLLLGTSETVDGASDLYTLINRESHIYQVRETTMRSYPIPESVPHFQLAKNDALQKPEIKEARQRVSFGELHQKLLENYAPPSVVVNEEYEIVHMTEGVGQYLEFTGGEPSQNLLKLIRPELRLELRSVLYQAVQHKTVVEARNVKLMLRGQVQSLHLQVRPVVSNRADAQNIILILFKPAEAQADDGPVVLAADEPVAKRLEEELILLKTQLRNAVEQHEFQEEELKASNEELQAMNEELRSAAEELETSKEELQSINEELRTVNQELKVKIEEISLTSNNFQNLINSTNVGTIFLDRSFSIRFFTPATLDIFNLKSGDYGRPVTDITNKLQYDSLLHDAETVLQKLTVVEREVTTNDNRHFMMRLLPYRTVEDRINGVVITFFDITKRKASERALQQSEAYLNLLIESAKDYAIFTLDPERRIVSWSTGAEGIMGYSEAEMTGQWGDILFTPEDRQKGAPEGEAETAATEGRAENERWHVRKNGSRFWASGSVSPLRDNNGALVGFVKIMRDLTERKEVEVTKYFLAAVVESSNDSVVTVDPANIITSWNRAAEHLYGYPAAEVVGKSLTMLTLPGDLQEVLRNTDAVMNNRTVVKYDTVRVHKDEHEIMLEIVLSPVKNDGGEIVGVSTVARDITERKRHEEEQRKAAEIDAFRVKLSDALRPLSDAVAIEEAVTREARDYFGADRCYYCQIVEDNATIHRDAHREDLPSVAGTYPLSSIPIFKAVVDGGKPFVVEDAHTSDKLDESLRQLCIDTQIISFMDVPIIKDGDAVGILCITQCTPRAWTRAEIDLAVETAERTWAAVERAKAEEALRESEAKYRTLFNSIDEAFATFEMIFDETGKAVDFIVVETNPVFERQTGHVNAVGKNIRQRQFNPNIEQEWLDFLARPLETGESARREDYSHDTDRWFSAHVSPVGGSRSLVTVVFDNITERKRREANLVLLAELAEDFARLDSEAEIMQRIGERLARHLGLDAISFSTVDEGSESVTIKYNWSASAITFVATTFRIVDYMSEGFVREMRAGKTWVAADVRTDERTDAEAILALNIGAYVAVPYQQGGEWSGVFTVTDDKPRAWTVEEIALIEEVSNRTFPRLERARAEEALRESEARLQLALDAAELGTFSWFVAEDRTIADARALAHFGYTPNADATLKESLARIYHPDDGPPYAAAIQRAIDPSGPGTLHQEFRIRRADGERWMEVTANTVFEGDPPTATRITGVLADITSRKQAEARQQYLLRLSDALRTLSNPDDVLNGALKTVGEYLDLDRVGYNEIDPAVTEYWYRANYVREGFSSMVGRYPMEPFQQTVKALQKGITFITNDAYADSFSEREKEVHRSINVGAYVTVPLVKNGRWVCNLVAQYSRPRRWTKHEISLLEDTAERIWAAVEQAKAEQALRLSEERLQLATTAGKTGTFIYYPMEDRGEPDSQMLALFGLPLHGTLNLAEALGHIIHPDDRERYAKEMVAATDPAGNGKLDVDFRIVHPDGSVRWIHITAQAFFEGDPPHPTKMPGVAIDITERKQAEEALRQSEGRLQRMVNIPYVGVLTFDYDGNVLHVNDAFLQMVHHSRDEFEKRKFSWRDFTPQEHMEASNVVMQQLRETGVGGPYEKEYFRSDGSRVWFLFVGADLDDGTIVEYAFDISDRKQAEEALGISERRFRTLTDAVPQVIWSNDAEGRANYFNQRWYEYSGLTFEESFGLGWEAIVHPDDAPASVQKWHEALAKGEIFDTEYRLRNAAGHYCWFVGRNVPLKDNAGKITGWFGSATDINDLKNVEEALRQSKERLQLIIESARGFAIFTTTVQDIIDSWSPGAAEIFGWQEEEIIGKSGDVVFTPEDRARNQPKKELEQAVAEGMAPNVRWHLHKNGSLVFINGAVHPTYDAAGALSGFVKIGRDMTAQHNAETALRKAEEAYRTTLEKEVEQRTVELKEINNSLRYANENLQQFATIASHDLQEPLRKLRMFASILQRFKNEMPEEGKEVLSKIHTTSDRMSLLIREVLQYSKIAYGIKEFAPTDLDGVLKNVLSDLELLLSETGAVIDYETALPQIDAIPLQMSQLFYNLLTNALKFRKDGVTPHIRISALPAAPDTIKKYTALHQNKAYVEIHFSDNGIGFDEQFAEQIFQIFERLHPVDEFEGTGVGLALCKKIVENHNGHIVAASKEGEGASFTIILPVSQ